MSRSSLLSLTLVAVLGLTACGGDSHEALAKESVSIMQDFGDTLAKITDKASAEKHVGELEELVVDMQAVKARMEKQGDPSAEEEAELPAELEQEMGSAIQKMSQEMMRIGSNPEIMQIVQPVLEQLDG